MSRVLVVDDVETIRELADLILSQAGYEVTTARDGVVALDVLRHAAPDLILLDINMPRMSGLEVLRILRSKRGVSVPVLMMTADQSADTVRQVLALGGNGYVLKPFQPHDLLGRVSRALAPPRARREPRRI